MGSDNMYDLLTNPLVSVPVIIVICIISVLLKSNPKSSKNYKYSRKSGLLTKNELAFYRELCKAASSLKLIVMPKVRVADIIEPKKGSKNYQGAFNRISSKHLDFVLCDSVTTKPLLAIELDDKSHDTANAKSRDEVKNSALKSAAFPLLRLRNAEGLQVKIKELLKQPQTTH
jgi:hypothetical protein